MASLTSWSTRAAGAAMALAVLCPPTRAQSLSEAQIFAELVSHNVIRNEALREYTAARTYRISSPNGKVHAQIDGRMEFQAPDRKKFVTASEEGSAIVRRLALNSLIATEIKTAGGKDRHDSAITPANYRLELIGEELVRGYRCYVLRAFPKRVDKYLFEGKVWVDQRDFAAVKIEGHPAANLSFWIKRADFVREFQKVDGFWLPMRDETAVDVRLYGKKLLTIEHHDYTVRGGYDTDARDSRAPPR